ncbi:MAG: hypothetical protein IKC69_05830 [Clostridia bacterium]|nr:hypothetical protein [Clostridia bacterium]
MDLDRKLLEKVSLLDDDTLRSAIGSIAAEMGLDPRMTAPYLADLQGIRQRISGLDAEDLERVRDALGEENTRALAQRIKNEIGDR